MRRLHNGERKQRGCDFCADMVRGVMPGDVMRRKICPYDECPYHELDKYETYNQFLKHNRTLSVAQIRKALKSVTSCD